MSEPRAPRPSAPAPPDFTRAFIEKLSQFDWMAAPEVALEPDGDVGFDWYATKDITISAHISATGRAGWASLVNGQTTHGSFQWPDWPDALTDALRTYENAADAAAAVRAAGVSRRSEWQSIETAPKDGEWVLLYQPDNGPSVAAWMDRDILWWFIDDGKGWHAIRGAEPTHWMSLPDPPGAAVRACGVSDSQKEPK